MRATPRRPSRPLSLSRPPASAGIAGPRRQPGLRRRRQRRRDLNARLHRDLQPRRCADLADGHVGPVRQRDRHGQLRRSVQLTELSGRSSRGGTSSCRRRAGVVGTPLPTPDDDPTPSTWRRQPARSRWSRRHALGATAERPAVRRRGARAYRRPRRLRHRELLRGRRRRRRRSATAPRRSAAGRLHRQQQQQAPTSRAGAPAPRNSLAARTAATPTPRRGSARPRRQQRHRRRAGLEHRDHVQRGRGDDRRLVLDLVHIVGRAPGAVTGGP